MKPALAAIEDRIWFECKRKSWFECKRKSSNFCGEIKSWNLKQMKMSCKFQVGDFYRSWNCNIHACIKRTPQNIIVYLLLFVVFLWETRFRGPDHWSNISLLSSCTKLVCYIIINYHNNTVLHTPPPPIKFYKKYSLCFTLTLVITF